MSCTCGKSYIVKQGDTLFLIAERELGDGNRWREIMNPDCTPVNDTTIFPDQELCLPNGSPSNQINLEARFYSMEETRCHTPASGVHGVTLRAALAGQSQSQCPGQSIGRLQCAVDPNVIPLLTNFTLMLWDGSQVPATALDIGTAIVGKKIDIFVDTNDEAINLGVKSVTAIL